jgi:NDMA-dependent alcohol dehydrogenase
MVRTRAAILWQINTPWSVEEIELDPPREREVLVKMAATGLCHSDEHILVGDLSAPLPIVGGHEGAGVVIEVGPGVSSLQIGDHVSTSYIPSCGRCRWCSSGQQNLCDLGAQLLEPGMMPDSSFRHHASSGADLSPVLKLGTFAQHIVASEDSLVRVDAHHDLKAIALLSCGVATGYGSAVHRADVKVGEVVVVAGIGGIGSAAVQGARLAGAARVIAVDPLENKRELAMEFGATHTAASLEDAAPLAMETTNGQGADKVILTAGVVTGSMIAPAMALLRKGGTCVVTGLGPETAMDTQLSLVDLTLSNKEIKGTLFGSGNPRNDIPHLAMLYGNGQLKVDEMITRTYSLDEINEGYQDMRDGKNIRGVVVFD